MREIVTLRSEAVRDAREIIEVFGDFPFDIVKIPKVDKNSRRAVVKIPIIEGKCAKTIIFGNVPFQFQFFIATEFVYESCK